MDKYCTAREATDNVIIWRIRIACWINKATDSHSENEILFAILLQQWLHERTPMLTIPRTLPVLLIY
jgi:hypothetical protein